MPEMDGLEAVAMIKRVAPTVRTLLLSGAPIESGALDVLDAGVDGSVHKDISPADLALAIRKVSGGSSYLGPEVIEAMKARALESKARPVPLSPREKQVLQLMATASTYREIGQQLFISEETVRSHAKKILLKLEQPNRTQAVIAAHRAGLIDLD
jgi:DNA-binding NarL/FixJ family response regulator